MRFMAFAENKTRGLAVEHDGVFRGLLETDKNYPGDLPALIRQETLPAAAKALAGGDVITPEDTRVLAPLEAPGKIICIGLNFIDHTQEVAFEQPAYPTVFTRFASTLVGHGGEIVRPKGSLELDYEGEIAFIIGRGGRHIAKKDAAAHIAGWSLFNDASIRDYQFKSPQWTMGKNFDATGAFGPCFVTSDEFPELGRGVKLETRLNGETVQSASTDDMVFDIPTLVEVISEVMTLSPGDVIVSGTPAGVGMAREPKLWMKPGDCVEVEAEGLGILRNTIVDEA